jgi:hypothetical protein
MNRRRAGDCAGHGLIDLDENISHLIEISENP